MIPLKQTELIAAGLRRLEKNGWREGLLGPDADAVLPAYEAANLGGLRPSLSIETLLTGERGCDVCIGLYKGRPEEHMVPEHWDDRCRAAVRVLKQAPEKRSILFSFDLRGGAAPDRVAGIYYRHFGHPEEAKAFLDAVGAGDRAEGYLSAAGRLPLGFEATYAGIFFGRAGSPIRLETMLAEEVRERISREVGCLERCLSAVGFEAISPDMAEHIRRLAALGQPISFQFDVNPDGTLRDSLALTVFYESLSRSWREAFAEDGVITRNLALFREAGIADERMELLRAGSFSVCAPGTDEQGRPFTAALVSWPECCKMKWTGGRLLPARWYQRMEAGYC